MLVFYLPTCTQAFELKSSKAFLSDQIVVGGDITATSYGMPAAREIERERKSTM